MKRISILILVLFVSYQSLTAQQAIAKLKFEEAEEAYAQNDYKTTITKLTEAEAILKSSNPRILYLRIMAQSNIVKKNPLNDYKILESTRKLCTKYLNSYDNLPNNEDKYKDIYHEAEILKKYPESEAKFIAKITLLDSIHKVGYKYMYGIGTTDYKKAYDVYKEASDEGDAIAENALGNLFLRGLGIQPNYTMASNLFELSSAKGDLNGQISLARFIISAEGLEELVGEYMVKEKTEAITAKYNSDKKALENRMNDIYKLVAAHSLDSKYQLDPKTLLFFGCVYRDGLYGYTKDENKAMQYFKLAVDNTDAESQYYLAMQYYAGRFLQGKDYAQAIKYFNLAIQYGKSDAGMFAVMHEIYINGGYGIQKNKKEARICEDKMMKELGMK